MIRLSRSLAAAAAVALVLGAGSWASAERGRHGHPRPSLERAVEALGLDATASERVDKILESSRSAKRELYRSLREQHQALRTLLEDTATTEEAALTQSDAIGQIQDELRRHQLRTLFQVRAELTPEQQQKLAAAMNERGKREHRAKHGKSCAEKSGKPERSETPDAR